MKKVLIKKFVITVMIVTMFLLQSQVFATGGQASGTNDSVYDKTVSYFFELVRSMETATGTLGKSSNINTTNYVDSSGNGIDCHLEKNTEYGTVTLLAASAYGNATSNDTTSTGANNTGVFQMSNGKVEYVANTLQESESSAKISNSYNKALTNADSRYVDEYKSTSKYSIPGDGILDTDGWSASAAFVETSYPVFHRGNGGFFGYHIHLGYASNSVGCRAVVVCGAGL